MDVIYAPKGRAQEYAESKPGAGDGLALNIFDGSPHGCAYCYVPELPFTSAEAFRGPAKLRKDFMARLEKDCKKLQGCEKPLHLCFTCDPYPEGESGETREVLLMLAHYQFKNVQILTKGGMRPRRDFDLMSDNNWAFGATVIFVNDFLAAWPDENDEMTGWEPTAACFQDREAALQIAHDAKIKTWVSIEPVIFPLEALEVIDRLKPWVDLFKIGKLNARLPEHKAYENDVDWKQFCLDAETLLGNHPHIFKQSLLKAAGRI